MGSSQFTVTVHLGNICANSMTEQYKMRRLPRTTRPAYTGMSQYLFLLYTVLCNPHMQAVRFMIQYL